jgi:predicted NUDIX family phosphoesterase
LTRQEFIPDSGFQSGIDSRLLASIASEGFFVPRQEAEHCAGLKQIILYLVLRHRQSLFVYQRVNATTETRLMHMYSIGLGGHINPGCDRNRLFSANLFRELNEEVQFRGHFSYRLLGVVNDDRSEVGRYHLGLVYLVTCTTPEIRVRETEKLTGTLMPAASAAAYLPSMETWSALIIPDISRMIG